MSHTIAPARIVRGDVSSPALRSRPEDLIPGGIDPPPGIPPAIFEAAVHTFLSERKFDIVGIAADHGLSRATLYRKVRGGREELLAEVIWYLTRRMFARSLESAEGRVGVERILLATRAFHAAIVAAPAFHRILATDADLALRIMSSWRGPVRPGLIAASEALIAEEQRLGGLGTGLDASTLAYVAVRIGESFLYDAALTRTDPDIEQHIAVLERLLA